MSTVPNSSARNALRLRTTMVDGEAVVQCSGRLTSEYSELLREEVGKLIPQGKRVVLDLTELRHMDSSGLGTVVRLYVSAKAAGCELRLVNLNQHIRDLLGMTNLLSVFGTCGQYMTRLP